MNFFNIVSPMVYAILIVVGVTLSIQYLILPLCHSPLSKIPAAHCTSPFSSLWIYYVRWAGLENVTLHRLHQSKGPILRIGPNEISINCYDGFKTIYSGGFDKTEFYINRFSAYGIRNMISMIHQEEHLIRRRMFADVFSRSKIWASHSLRSAATLILYERLLPIIGSAANSGVEIDIHPLTCAYSIDLLQAYQFGISIASNLVQNYEQRETCLDQYFSRVPYLFWISEFPSLVSFSSWLGLGVVPKSVTKTQKDLEDSMLKSCDDAAKLVSKGKSLMPEDIPVVYSQEYNAFQKADRAVLKDGTVLATGDHPARHRLEIASDMLDFNVAALETSGDAFIWIYFQLSLHPDLQVELREELLTLSPAMKFPSKEKSVLPDPQAVHDLRLLDAIIQETLRLYPASDGGQRRVTPSPSCNLVGHKLPPGVVVQASAYSRHYNPEVFPDPEKWKPKRWLNASPEQLLKMKRWFWAFGGGSMMCIGNNFAMYSMKYAVAAIYTNFASECINPNVRIPIDKEKGSSIGARHELLLRFRSVRDF